MTRPDDVALDLATITDEQRQENVRLTVEAESHRALQAEECCEGFRKLVQTKSIHLASGQMVLGGRLSSYAYYWLGPARNPEEGMFAQFCPCCGKEVASTAAFLAKAQSGEG